MGRVGLSYSRGIVWVHKCIVNFRNSQAVAFWVVKTSNSKLFLPDCVKLPLKHKTGFKYVCPLPARPRCPDILCLVATCVSPAALVLSSPMQV